MNVDNPFASDTPLVLTSGQVKRFGLVARALIKKGLAIESTFLMPQSIYDVLKSEDRKNLAGWIAQRNEENWR